ncbi:Sensory box histidine kinase/response regulator [Anaerovibrio sp. JC8]|uniref:ATP-binding protein n=1 Tax=Anaerovibrio sp. JC8 TaxID=1240085 RepID=UPI000A0C73B4|nr:ATP-binding protein [Anaerovibrio sp. JC8]ORT99114.1 Sensory box histidine kinase/response regulator [Anaerovibrio sp. JC8]
MSENNVKEKETNSGMAGADMESLVVERAIHDNADFIGYIDVNSGKMRIVRHNCSFFDDDGELVFDYDEKIGELIDEHMPEEDRSICHRMLQLSNIVETVNMFGEFTGTFKMYRDIRSPLQYKKLTLRYLDRKEKSTLVAVQTDITEITTENRQMQDALRGALKHAETVSKAKSQLLFQMSREIRTPLNTIVGMTGLGKDRSDQKDYVKYCLDKIEDSSKILLDMIENVLALSHVEQNSIQLNSDVVLFQPFIDTVAEKARADAYAKKINFQLELDPNVAKCFRFDADRMRQVLKNVLNNAIKFTQRFGSVTLGVKCLAEKYGRQSLEFSVKDTGVGIEDEFKPKVFEAFSQEYTGNSNIYGGSGLGLAICNHIVKKMGGIIDFDSAKGVGTTFRINVDLDVATSTYKPKDDEEDICRGRRVLLAEDNEINLEIGKQLLLARGMVVDTAENGQEALSQYMSNAPGTYDLILMDVRMPYMDGLIATKKIRTSGKSDSKKVPILALTANARDEDIRQSFEHGMNAHLTKPINVEELYRSIEKALRGELVRHSES